MTVYNEDWEREAPNWAAWARTPGHDAYWRFSGPTFFELVPPPGRRTLDLGCGEGRVARDLAARAHRVVGLDASPTLLGLAREADPGASTFSATRRRCRSQTASSTSSSPSTR